MLEKQPVSGSPSHPVIREVSSLQLELGVLVSVPARLVKAGDLNLLREGIKLGNREVGVVKRAEAGSARNVC